MNSHPVFIAQGVGSPQRDSGSPHLETLTSNSNSTFQPLTSSFHPQTTTYYSTPATYHLTSSYGQDSKDYMTSIHGLTPVRLPALSSSLSGVSDLISTSMAKEHPAAVQADQMNTYMEYFVEQGSSEQGEHPDTVVMEEVVVDGDVMDAMGKEVVMLEQDVVDDGMMGGEHLEVNGDVDEGDMVRYAHIQDPHDQSIAERHAELIKKKRQIERERREMERREMERREMDELINSSGDISDPEVLARIRSETSKARRAEAARSRYQRMTEAERKAFNQRRRLKALGIDPDQAKEDGAEVIRDSIKMANAKKAAAARERYHRMTEDEKRLYNQRRTESFRKRREEEEILLSTPAGCISPDALAKAQQIMIRNARKAEAARARYQRMTPEQRREYNVRRAQSKKCRNQTLAQAALVAEHHGSSTDMEDDDFAANGSLGPSSISLNSSFTSEPPANILEPSQPDPSLPATSQAPPIRTEQDEIFQQLERDVLKRTKQAQMILTRQRQHDLAQQQQSMIRFPNTEMTADGVIITDAMLKEGYDAQTSQMMIDEKALHNMLVTGRDANGMAVELKTMDGQRITQEHQLSALGPGQTIVIAPAEHPLHLDSKDTLYVQGNEGHLVPSTSGGDQMYSTGPDGFVNAGQMSAENAHLLSMAEKHQLAKAKRAERARIRYRNMQPELRQAQNARRADLLRKSRARDEQLVQMADTTDTQELAPETQRAIQEAQMRRSRRAEQARNKYHRMSSEERRQYNAVRDAQRRQRKRQQEMNREANRSGPGGMDMDNHHLSGEPSASNSMSPQHGETVEERIIYSGYEMYDEPMHSWDQ